MLHLPTPNQFYFIMIYKEDEFIFWNWDFIMKSLSATT